MDSSEKQKVTVDSLTNHLKIEDKDAFILYLKELWVDLFSRVKENKNDKKEMEVKLTGVTKLIFDKYFSLPGIIGDRFFRVLDTKNTTVLSLSDFVKGMTTLFCGGYEETVKFIFNFYDMDNDGIINKEDIRIVLSYITLDDSPDIKSSGINISYTKRIKSQEELYIILQKSFEKIPNNKMNFQTFKNVIENVNSDIYLLIYIFLLENKPFTKENIKSYQNKKPKGKDSSKNITASEKNLIMSPSKNSNFSPYKVGFRNRGRRTTVVNKEVDISKILDSKISKKNVLQNIVNKKENDYKRKGRKRKTVQYESNIINLKDIKDEDEEKKNKIKEGRVKDLTRKRKQNKDIPEDQMQIKPAFKQTIKKGRDKSDYKSKNKKKNKEEEEALSFDNESDGSSDIDDDEEEEEEDDDDILKYEGTLYKLVDGKMRELYFKLVHKDLYFYKNKGDSKHKGMHNLSGLFLQREKTVTYEGTNYYSFSVVYPTKTRIYYCKNEKE